ncbi:lipid-A-disaccharide synthase [Millionella massiliensis]|uniref:lipid-A-disaccharide synthase n=1 Tax=Millionella massiliensis TaxID=1871023 RepID=UPI0024B63C67|nr:lipid-A-disaccharide synthase [Millionella massiliensis]
MRYYIIAGEASGDLHGSNLIKGLLHTDPEAEIRFWGGDKMIAAAGSHGTLVRHYKEASIMGFWEVLKNLRRISRQMRFCREDIAAWHPDVLILIDYPGFNLRMARFVHTHCWPDPDKRPRVFYYIAPKVWAWKEKRVVKLREYVDKLFIIFPFEIEYFRRHGIEAFYGGNPLMDSVSQRPAITPETAAAFRRENHLDERPIIALVAGSRSSEIQYNLPNMVAVSRLFPDYQFVVTGVSWLDRALYDRYLANSDVRFVCDKTYETIALSAAALVTSGTATLETALLNIPEVVCFRSSGISIWIAKKLVKLRFISLVNLIMDREVVRELIQEMFTPAIAADELRAVLPDGSKHERMLQDFRDLRVAMGEAGASERVAAEMVRILTEKQPQ